MKQKSTSQGKNLGLMGAFAFVLLTSFLLSGRAFAIPIINDFGLTHPYVTLTFDEKTFDMGTVIKNQYSNFGVRFDTVTLPEYEKSDFRYDVQGLGATFRGIEGHYIGSSGGNPVYINFKRLQDSVAFGMASNPRNMTITALLGGVPVETFSFYTSGGSYPSVNGDPAGYYGFSGISFNQIEIFSTLIIYYDNRVLIDNIQSTPIPEPCTTLLFGSGLLGLAGYGRKKFFKK